jgi:hypothetical protein
MMFSFITWLCVWVTLMTASNGLPRDTLLSGAILKQNEHLVSENKAYHAVMQGDGNFVVYVSHIFHPKNAIWYSATNSIKPFVGPYRLVMQDDGNLVVYDVYDRAVWNSQTQGKTAKPHRLVMQNDGNLVLYDGNSQSTWNSGTQRNRRSLM